MTPDKLPTSRGPILFDARNLVVGGGVQVAASLVDELIRRRSVETPTDPFPWLSDFRFEISPQVAANVTSAVLDDPTVGIARSNWADLRRWWSPWKKDYRLQLVVFGPRYGWRRARTTLVGIADGTSIYQWPAGVPQGSLYERTKRAFRSRVARFLFANEDYLISESASLIGVFRDRTGYPADHCFVIPNVVNQAVLNPDQHCATNVRLEDLTEPGTRLIGYIARKYPHKNHDFLADVHEHLRAMGEHVRFAVTLTTDEWNEMDPEFHAACVNAGLVQVNQIADFNNQCDAMIFPSLLESQSATPLEVMATNGLLFASDREFVRESTGAAAAYFDPCDPKGCAELIVRIFRDPAAQADLRREAASRSAELSTAGDRAASFLDAVSHALSRDSIGTEN